MKMEDREMNLEETLYNLLGITKESVEQKHSEIQYSESDLFSRAIWNVKREFIDTLTDYNPNIIVDDGKVYIEEYAVGEFIAKDYDPMCDIMSICITKSKSRNDIEGIMLRTWFLDSRKYEAFGLGYENYEKKYVYTNGNGIKDITNFKLYTRKAEQFLAALLRF